MAAPEPSRRVKLTDFNSIPDWEYLEAVKEYEAEQEALRSTNNGAEDDWQAVDLSQLGPRPPVQPTLGGVGLVYPGERHVFSGPPESAKTLAAYAIGLEVIRAGGTIVIIDFEMGRWQARDRLVELGATPGELGSIYYVDPVQPATEARIGPFVRSEPQLVIIDAASGAYDNLGLDDNKRGDVERFTRIYVNAFWRAGIATIVLDHVVKNADNRGKYVIGSERKLGGSQVHLGFDAVVPIKRGGTGIYKITNHKDRGGYLERGRLADLHLTSDPATHQITWEFREVEHSEGGHGFRPTVLMEHVSGFLADQDEPVSYTYVRAGVTGEDKYIGMALDRLIEEGYATESKGPRGARLVTHAELYTGQPAPTTPAQADAGVENQANRPLRTPADPCAQGSTTPLTTPASPFKDAGDAGVGGADAGVDAGAGVDVYDPAIQAMLDGPGIDDGIPF